MSLPPRPGDPLPYLPPPPPPRTGLGLGAGAALGAFVGLAGPVALGVLAALAGRTDSGELVSLLVVLILGLPVLLLVAGCLLMIPYELRGWGVAALMASGVWLISSAGVCTLFVFGALGA